MWYPLKKEELEKLLEELMSKEEIKNHKPVSIHGLIVPHAGYEFSGKIAAKAYPLIKGKKRAIILSPSHYFPLNGAVCHDQKDWQTPLGSIKVMKNNFRKANLTQEHAIDNQIPFLQKMKIREILPLVIGRVDKISAETIAKQLEPFADNETVFIVSTDLSHFLPYENAVIRDRNTIKLIENLDEDNFSKIDACGIYPLKVLFELCKLKSWKPKLIISGTSADSNNDKEKVVGYASLSF